MTTVEELEKAKTELEAKITDLVSAFLVEHGNCIIDINVNNEKILIDKGRTIKLHPKITVALTI